MNLNLTKQEREEIMNNLPVYERVDGRYDCIDEPAGNIFDCDSIQESELKLFMERLENMEKNIQLIKKIIYKQ